MTLVIKDPGSRSEFAFDWGDVVRAGQALTVSEWTVEPVEAGGVVVAGAAHAGLRAAVTLTGGIAGHVYRATNRVTLNDGQIDERSLTVRVEER
ncbi:MAG: hypothetical protein U0S50_00835 [Sphingopyxis sp.]|uniref:phage fiber-tail adaptor protein n=1 Tax=Sphingopyxis sp. TaxID=1908224 RepID=UPI002ABB7A37|nr:hypothetical protein [Sphingopyxis sp.]MDZ3830344.1 hypothetical protein [Sphingopyxis sp.]